MKRVVMMMAMAGALSALAAPELRPLGAEQMGYYGATHEVSVGYADLTETAANVAQTNTVTLTGPCSVSWAGWLCATSFDTAARTNLVSMTMTASLGSQSLISAVQVASDQFRTYRSIAPTALSVTTLTEGPATNQMVSTSTGTWPYTTVLTNGQSTTLTLISGAPGASHALKDMTQGRARLFLRIW